MKTIYLFISLVIAAAAVAHANEQKKEGSPSEVYQMFLIALVEGDNATAERLVIPNKELSLLTSTPVPTEHRKEAIAAIKATQYRVLKVGEVFTLPGGGTLSPTKEMEKKGWVMIGCDADPLPHMLQKIGGAWRIDVSDLIVARKAAAARKK
jgi:hypothetical protein